MSRSDERIFMHRTMIISGVACIAIAVLLGLMAARLGLMAVFIDLAGPVIAGVMEIALLTLLFIGLLILVGNLREWYGEVAGWFDVIALWLIVILVAAIAFGGIHALLTALLCIGFVYYLHLAQD